MIERYKADLSGNSKEKSIISKILKTVKKDWKIKIVDKSDDCDYSVTYEYEFEEGLGLCYFVKDSNYIHYCGPINVRRKKMEVYTLWIFDYLFYANGESHITKNLSYIWDTMWLKKFPENLIYNPCVVADISNELQMIKVMGIYEAEQIGNTYFVNMHPSDDVVSGRIYQISFYKNEQIIRTIECVQEFEPSILRIGTFTYKNKGEEYYTEYNFIENKEYAESLKCEESSIRRKEEEEFWELLYTGNDSRYFPERKMNASERALFENRVSLYSGDYCEYYISIKEQIAEIIINNFFAQNVEVEQLSPLFEEDFSHNYRIRIKKNDVANIKLFLFFCKVGMITKPAVCGIEICEIIRNMKNHPCAMYHPEMENVIKLLKTKISKSVQKIIERWMILYPYKALIGDSYYLKYRSDDERALYYFVCDNIETLRNQYNHILQELMEKGKLPARWKSEFALFVLAKSYFPDTIFQYRSEWLAGQSLDIFIPQLNMGIEYQGRQHYEAIEFFGGEESFVDNKNRDNRKKAKCIRNNVKLVEWSYQDEVCDENFRKMIQEQKIVIPTKKNVDYVIKTKQERNIEKTQPVICQYTESGVLLQIFSSYAEAENNTGIKVHNIHRACSGFRKTAGGYQWRENSSKDEVRNILPVEVKKQTGMPRAIIQYNLDGSFVEEYKSVSEAVNCTNINSKSIRDAANGKQKHAGGFLWKYKENL